MFFFCVFRKGKMVGGMGVLKRDARFAHSHFLLYDQRRGGMRGGKAIQKLIRGWLIEIWHLDLQEMSGLTFYTLTYKHFRVK